MPLDYTNGFVGATQSMQRMNTSFALNEMLPRVIDLR
jgi:hypothetical protein